MKSKSEAAREWHPLALISSLELREQCRAFQKFHVMQLLLPYRYLLIGQNGDPSLLPLNTLSTSPFLCYLLNSSFLSMLRLPVGFQFTSRGPSRTREWLFVFGCQTPSAEKSCTQMFLRSYQCAK